MRFWVVSLAIVFAMLRLCVHPGKPDIVDLYKDVVHLFMGGLFVAAYRDCKPWQWWTFGLLSVWEIVVAIASRM